MLLEGRTLEPALLNQRCGKEYMGTWISHLRIAENLLKYFPQVDEATFAFGNLSPDSGIPNADWTEFDPPKEVTHFLIKGEEEYAIHDLVYYEQYLANVKPEDDIKLYSFRLGYFFHLICDIMWARRIVIATRRDFQRLYDKSPKEAVGIIKDDWYGLDQLYVREHPEHIFWRVIMTVPYPSSYLPFVKNEALYHQYDHIRKYYSAQEDKWFLSLPYCYLNEKTMTRIVDDSIKAVLIVHEKVREIKSFDGLKSSVSLLPDYLTTPYEEPLGNVSP
jgi:hypothetical protein